MGFMRPPSMPDINVDIPKPPGPPAETATTIARPKGTRGVLAGSTGGLKKLGLPGTTLNLPDF